MSTRTLLDGTPIPEDLAAAHRELSDLALHASRSCVALRCLSGALSEEDEPVPERYRAGLLEAVAMVGDYMEYYAADRMSYLEHIIRLEHDRKPSDRKGVKS